MAKARTSTKSKTKAELLQEAVAEAVGAGKELHLESVDFSDPNRPKTCLEVDFPILHINQIASLEATSGAAKKPVYQMSKWWARRQSSIFRALLIAAATKAPDEPADAAKIIWDSYYANHQQNPAFRALKVADIFMGGGTTVVEGLRLGMQMYGNDLNPVAWLVVKNEVADVDPEAVKKLLKRIESEVKPQLMPFFACNCPRGHKGKWTYLPSGEVMLDNFDPLTIQPESRSDYHYDGPELVYTFWSKHTKCSSPECHSFTALLTSPVVASRTGAKSVTIKAWLNHPCKKCGKHFDIEAEDVRMCPRAALVVGPDEPAYSVMDENGSYTCPHCEHCEVDEAARLKGQSLRIGKPSTKKISLTVVIHPKWIKHATHQREPGGSADSSPESTELWNRDRFRNLSLVEVRGNLPASISFEDWAEPFSLDRKGGTVPKDAYFVCQEDTCGLVQKILDSTEKTAHTRPVSAYAVQIFCPECKKSGHSSGGRHFDWHGWLDQYSAADKEWKIRSETDLSDYHPVESIPYGSRTHIEHPLPRHGYTHWRKMFCSRQLLSHALFAKAIANLPESKARDVVVDAFQQHLRLNNLFTIWHQKNNQISASLSNSTFNVKNNVVETFPFASVGDGSWNSAVRGVLSGLEWKIDPWELVPVDYLQSKHPALAKDIKAKSVKVHPLDQMVGVPRLTCESATDLRNIAPQSLDLVITDPPFEGLIQYSETADFFYVWLKLILGKQYPDQFSNSESPKALEAVYNPIRHGDSTSAQKIYTRLLTSCWSTCHRLLKSNGILAFTFHHSEDEPWMRVLQSLFEAGFVLESAYPIRSDESKGDGDFGSQKVEFDIIHVCKKRLNEPEPISWARLRRQIMRDVHQLREIIEQHQKEGLGEADLQVIRRGKALEYYSRHFGKVYIEKGREDEFTVKDALVGINQLLDDESDTSTDRPPESAEPYTRQFLRLFADKVSLDRDQIQKYLRGTGVSPSEFVDRGWCTEEKKIFTIADPLAWAQDWKGKSRRTMARDFDQAYFLIGASYENSGIKVSDTLGSETFVPHPALVELLTWFVKHSPTEEMRAAAKRAQHLYSAWQAKNTKVALIQRTLFDLEE